MFLQKILFLLAKITLAKYKPEIIGITGSVGKTSTKEAIYLVLKNKFETRRNLKSFNNEIGLPLTILGLKTAGKSIFLWTKNFFHALGIIFFPNKYPKILVLELGADKPDDLNYLLKIIKPYLKIGIVTKIGTSHLEFFKKEEKIFQEKSKLIKALPKQGTAIINFDCPQTKKITELTETEVISFGFDEQADLKASDIIYSSSGISFKVHFKGNVVPMKLLEIFGEHQIYQTLAAIAIGICYNLSLVEIANSLLKFSSLAGRMKLIYGIKQTLILDDTYNASPDSTITALKTISKIKEAKKIEGKIIAVLGDMLELGDFTEQGHRQVGKIAAEISDVIIAVGEKVLFLIDQAKKENFPFEKIFHFSKSEEAGRFIQDKILEKNDLLLVKGSQGMRMEKIVKELMAEPLMAEEMLVRQEKEWLNR